MFKLPEAGILLILAVDHFLDMGRTATNIIGNSVATAVIAKTEGNKVEEHESVLAQPLIPNDQNASS